MKTCCKDAVQLNLAAIISIFIAGASLGYDTWRTDAVECNRHQRLTSNECLPKPGERQEPVVDSHFDPHTQVRSNPETAGHGGKTQSSNRGAGK
jgi:hypothetical protein